MGQVVAINDLSIQVADVTGQRSRRVRVSPDATVGEWVEDVVGRLRLKRKDADGNPYAYRPRLEREGRHLHASEIVGEVLQTDDRVVMHPNVNAG